MRYSQSGMSSCFVILMLLANPFEKYTVIPY